jgi:hypothetical protein
MTTLGNSATPLSGFDNPGSGFAFASSYTTPSGSGILIQTLHAYFDSAGGASTGYCCVWDNSGTLLASVNVGTLNVKTGGVGNALDWWSGNLATPLYVGPSTAIWIGGYATGSTLFNTESTGSSNDKSMGSGGPGSFSGSSSTGQAAVGAYVDYINAGGYVRRSGVWTAAPIFVRRSGAWVAAPVYVRRSGVWVPGA